MNDPRFRLVASVLIVGLLGAGTYFGIKARYGAYDEAYFVRVDLPRAGQLMRVGADVRQNGVNVGTVSHIRLVDRAVQLTLRIEPRYRVPADAEAVVALKTLLGDKFVDLRTEEYAEPFLADGDRIDGRVGDEFEEILAEGVDVFEAIRADDLATIVTELARASRGHGDDIRRSLVSGAELSDLFARTTDDQLRSLRDFRVIFEALGDRAFDLNDLADAVNEGVPVYASQRAQEDLRRALDALVPFAHHFADLLIFQRQDWDRMIDRGDVVLQAIADRPDGLHDLVHGLYRYVFKLGGKPPFLEDGTAAAPFANFFGGDEEEGGGEGDFAAALAEFCGLLPADTAAEILACQVAP
jgi:phospholipid/cholesterol/gamma-HCH transport system substrate-binding protein